MAVFRSLAESRDLLLEQIDIPLRLRLDHVHVLVCFVHVAAHGVHLAGDLPAGDPLAADVALLRGRMAVLDAATRGHGEKSEQQRAAKGKQWHSIFSITRSREVHANSRWIYAELDATRTADVGECGRSSDDRLHRSFVVGAVSSKRLILVWRRFP